MKNAVYTSLALHTLIFVLISITLPEIKTKEIDYIPIEIIVEEEDDDKIKEETVKNLPKEILAKNTEKRKAIIKPSLPREKPSEVKKEENIISEKNKIIPKIPNQKPKFNIDKPKDKIIEKKIVKNDIEENKDIFDDMLKNLEKPEPVNDNFEKIVNELAEKNSKIEKPLKKINIPNSDTLAKLEQNIAKQIREHYTIPPALDSVLVNDVKVPITINIREDGTITRIIIDKDAIKKAQKDPVYRSFLEAAERAVKKLSKFDKLPLDLYSHWDKISINFTPI